MAKQVIKFVYRDEDPGREVVRVLPEVRMSVQIMAHEPYWLRDAGAQKPWRQLPRIALWGPRYDWCYGFAAGRIRAYGIALRATAFCAIAGRPTSAALNTVSDLAALHPDLAAALDPHPREPFDEWRMRATSALTDFFATRQTQPDPIAESLHILATAEANAVALAASQAQLSERQYRRVFARFYGVSPKLYQRAIRVDRMIRQLHDTPWEADVFHDSPIAFADQPHSIREFRSMTGLTPGEYVRAKSRQGATLRSVPTTEISPP